MSIVISLHYFWSSYDYLIIYQRKIFSSSLNYHNRSPPLIMLTIKSKMINKFWAYRPISFWFMFLDPHTLKCICPWRNSDHERHAYLRVVLELSVSWRKYDEVSKSKYMSLNFLKIQKIQIWVMQNHFKKVTYHTQIVIIYFGTLGPQVQFEHNIVGCWHLQPLKVTLGLGGNPPTANCLYQHPMYTCMAID